MTAATVGATFAIGAVVCLAVMAWLAASAPAGYQDSDGFHTGEQPINSEGSPSVAQPGTAQRGPGNTSL